MTKYGMIFLLLTLTTLATAQEWGFVKEGDKYRLFQATAQRGDSLVTYKPPMDSAALAAFLLREVWNAHTAIGTAAITIQNEADVLLGANAFQQMFQRLTGLDYYALTWKAGAETLRLVGRWKVTTAAGGAYRVQVHPDGKVTEATGKDAGEVRSGSLRIQGDNKLELLGFEGNVILLVVGEELSTIDRSVTLVRDK